MLFALIAKVCRFYWLQVRYYWSRFLGGGIYALGMCAQAFGLDDEPLHDVYKRLAAERLQMLEAFAARYGFSLHEP